MTFEQAQIAWLKNIDWELGQLNKSLGTVKDILVFFAILGVIGVALTILAACGAFLG